MFTTELVAHMHKRAAESPILVLKNIDLPDGIFNGRNFCTMKFEVRFEDVSFFKPELYLFNGELKGLFESADDSCRLKSLFEFFSLFELLIKFLSFGTG